jgi:hypothetical protein
MEADCLLSFGRRKRVGNNAFFYTKCIRPHTDATTAIPLPASNSGTNRAPNTLQKLGFLRLTENTLTRRIQ